MDEENHDDLDIEVSAPLQVLWKDQREPFTGETLLPDTDLIHDGCLPKWELFFICTPIRDTNMEMFGYFLDSLQNRRISGEKLLIASCYGKL